MKQLLKYSAYLLFSSSVLICSCSDDNDPEPGPKPIPPTGEANFEMSGDELTFPAVDPGVAVIPVTAENYLWDITGEVPEWLDVVVSDTKLTIRPTENLTYADKEGVVEVKAWSEIEDASDISVSIPILQKARRLTTIIEANIGYGTVSTMSHNGRYLGGSSSEVSGFIWDAEEDLVVTTDYSVGKLLNDGSVLSSEGLSLEGIELPRPNAYIGTVWDISLDGSTVVGTIDSGSDFWPMKWVNGSPTLLDSDWSETELGAEVRGYQPRSMTENGEILGDRWDYYGGRVPFVWDAQGNMSRVFPITGTRYDNAVRSEVISKNGRFVLGYYVPESAVITGFVPWFYDREKGEHVVLEDALNNGYCVFANDDDEVFFIWDLYTKGGVYKDGRIQTHQDWAKEKFNIDLPYDAVIAHVSADGKYYGGFVFEIGEAFRITVGDYNIR